MWEYLVIGQIMKCTSVADPGGGFKGFRTPPPSPYPQNCWYIYIYNLSETE